MNAVARGHLDGFQVEGAGFVLASEYYLAKGLVLSCNFLKNSSSLFFLPHSILLELFRWAATGRSAQ